KFAKFAQEDVYIFGIAELLAFASNAVVGAHVSYQARNATLHLDETVGLAYSAAVLAVTAVSQTRAGAGIPQVSRWGLGKISLVIVIDSGPPRVRQRPVAGDVVRVVGHRRPGMAVTRHMAVAIQVVEQDKLSG